MKKAKLNLIISLVIGIGIFSIFIWYVGPDALRQIYHNSQPIYLIPYALITTILFFTYAWRLKIVLKAYGEKVGFWQLLRQNISGFALSYVTPAVRIGGEPLKVYMLKQESKVDYKVGTSAVLMDKFIEFTGTLIYGIIGLAILMFLNIPSIIKIILAAALLTGFSVLFITYYWTIKKGPGPFTNLFTLLRFYKFPKFRKLKRSVIYVEEKMEKFFRQHKKEFTYGCLTYILYGILGIFEAKFLLLAIGINATVTEVMIIVVIWGATNFIPVPAGLGFHEATQTGLFALLRGSGALGFAFALVTRVRQLFFTALGFIFASQFGSAEIMKRFEKTKSEKNFDK